MIRGATPTFKLTINDESIDLTDATSVYVTFRQPTGISLTKSGTDLEVAAKEVDVYLSQEETLKFREGELDIQLNWVYSDGKRACSKIVRRYVGENLIGSVLR